MSPAYITYLSTCVVNPTKNALRPECNLLPCPDSQRSQERPALLDGPADGAMRETKGERERMMQ